MSDHDIECISPAEALKRLREGARLIDVRDAHEFAVRHARGARNVPRERLIAEPHRDLGDEAVCLLICQSGKRSLDAAAALRGLEPCLVEVLQHPHACKRVQRDAAGEDQLVGAGRSQQVIDDMDQRVFQHHLGRRRLVEAILRVGTVLDVLDAQHRMADADLIQQFTPAGGLGGEINHARW